MCMIIKELSPNLRRRRRGYKVYRSNWNDDRFRGEYNTLIYTIGETYKAKTLDYDNFVGMATSNEYTKGIHVYLDYPKVIKRSDDRVVKVSFTKPIQYGFSEFNYENQEVALVNEVTLLKEVPNKC